MEEQILITTPEPITLERISYLINEKGIDPMIANLDLEMVKMKLMDEEEGLGWTTEQCDVAEMEYKRFLHLNKKFPDEVIVPHKTMDLMWHQHILDTRAYISDCNKIFGEYFHHFPYFGIRSEEDKQDLTIAFDETQNIYAKEFGDDMLAIKSSGCKSGCNSSGKCKSRKEKMHDTTSSKCTRNCVNRCKRACKT
jgi:hypothetical protein